MPSFIADDFRFLHTPKTGGVWAYHAMAAAGIASAPGVELSYHADLGESEAFAERFTIAFVRHPLDWWRSYWAYRMRTGWVMESHVDAAAASEDFDEFIGAVVAHAPGWASEVFQSFCGPPARPIHFIGRHERLVDDLERGLALAGARFDKRALRAEPPHNASDKTLTAVRYTPALARELALAESLAIERFYPGKAIPQRVLARRRRLAFPALRRSFAA
jgi:hypothetical protein